jgi:hypothetical protein
LCGFPDILGGYSNKETSSASSENCTKQKNVPGPAPEGWNEYGTQTSQNFLRVLDLGSWVRNRWEDGGGWLSEGTPTKRQVSKRLVSKRPVSKHLKRQVYKTSDLQNVRFTKCQVYKTSGLQNVRLQKNPFIFCTCGWLKSAGSVAAMLAGKVMAVFYYLF